MSKHQTIKAIREEISRINREIDLRIIQGISYKNLSLRHKFLMGQLARLNPERHFFNRSLRFISTFIF